jgi:hypothetical protein
VPPIGSSPLFSGSQAPLVLLVPKLCLGTAPPKLRFAPGSASPRVPLASWPVQIARVQTAYPNINPTHLFEERSFSFSLVPKLCLGTAPPKLRFAPPIASDFSAASRRT